MLRTIPRQLTLSYLAVVLLCLALAAPLLLDKVRGQLLQKVESAVTDRGDMVATLLTRRGWPPAVGDPERRILGDTMIALSLERIVVFDSRREVVLDSASLLPGTFRGGLRYGAPAPQASADVAAELAAAGSKTAIVRSVPPAEPVPGEASLISTLFVAVPIGRNVGTLVMRRPLVDVDLFMGTLQQSLAQVGVLAILLAVILSLMLSRHFTTPLGHLTRAAQRVAAGHLEERLDLRATAEFEQLSTAFNHMAAALEEHERVRSQFLADASHELKTPLTSLKALVDALERGALQDPAKASQFMRYMRDEIQRLESLVADLLDLHRLESGEMRIEVQPCDIRALVEQVAEPFRASLPPGCLRTAAGEPMMIQADPDRMRQVLINLLENARRAVHGRPQPLIEVSVSSATAGCTVTVEDNGPGIPSAEMERIFERFHRVDTGRSREQGGAGLGLCIARRIVLAHGGRMWAEPARDSGLRVQWFLPGA